MAFKAKSQHGPPDPPPQYNARIQFAEVPEIVFIEGFEDWEETGVFVLNPDLRTHPGDDWWKTGSRLKIREEHGVGLVYTPPTGLQFEIISGTMPTGLEYEASTGKIYYDGTVLPQGTLAHDFTAKFSYGYEESNVFRVRVLRPRLVWGVNAETRQDLPSTWGQVPKYNSYDSETPGAGTGWSYSGAHLDGAEPVACTDAEPWVTLVLAGTYTRRQQVAADGSTTWQLRARLTSHGLKPSIYLVGEPWAQVKLYTVPYVANVVNEVSSLAVDLPYRANTGTPGLEVNDRALLFIKNFETEGRIDFDGRTVNWLERYRVYTRLYCHDALSWSSDGIPSDNMDAAFQIDTSYLETMYQPWHDEYKDGVSKWPWDPTTGDASARCKMGPVDPARKQMDIVYNNEFFNWTGTDLKHNVYLHGRPHGYTITNNNFSHGASAGSAFKTTRAYIFHWNNRMWSHGYQEQELNEPGKNFGKFFDQPASSYFVAFNNYLWNGAYKQGEVTTEMIWFNRRNSLWGGNDFSRFTDVTIQEAPFRNFWFRMQDCGLNLDGSINPRLEYRLPSDEINYPEKDPVTGRHTFWRTATGNQIYWYGAGNGWQMSMSPNDITENGEYRVALKADNFTAAPPGPDSGTLYGQERQLHFYKDENYLMGTSSNPWYSVPEMPFELEGWYTRWLPGAGYWDAHASYGEMSPGNPLICKHFISYNDFMKPGPFEGCRPIRDETTNLSCECGSTGPNDRGPTPSGYKSVGVNYVANNIFSGWEADQEIFNGGYGNGSWFRTTDASSLPLYDGYMLSGEGKDWNDPAKTLFPGPNSYMCSIDPDTLQLTPDTIVTTANRTANSPTAPIDTPLPNWFRHGRLRRSALAKIADTIQPGQFVELSCPDLATRRDDCPESLLGQPGGDWLADVSYAMPEPDEGIYECAWNWTDNAQWDIVNRQIVWMGSNHYSEGQPENSKFYKWDDYTNEWRAKTNPTNNKKTGHGYAESAFDYKRRILWKYDSGTDSIYGVNVDTGAYWGRIYIPNSNMGWGNALVYHPLLDGLVFGAHTVQSSPQGKLYLRRSLGDTPYYQRTWETLSADTGFTLWHMMGHYHPMAGKVIIGGGHGEGATSFVWWTVDKNGVAERIDDSPYIISVSEPTPEENNPKRAQFVADPRSRRSVILSGDGNIYEFDWGTMTWGTQSLGTFPFINKNVISCSCPTYGVILFLKWGIAGTCRMYVYRHS